MPNDPSLTPDRPDDSGTAHTPTALPTQPSIQPAVAPEPGGSKRKRIIVVAVILLVLLGGAAATYFLAVAQDEEKVEAPAAVAKRQAVATVSPNKATQIVLVDTSAKVVTVTDSSGVTKYTVSYATSGKEFARAVSSSDAGDILLELGNYTGKPEYMLVDHTGKKLPVSQEIHTTLESIYNATDGSGWPAIFMRSANEALVTTCPEGDDNTYSCKLTSLNLANGQSRTILSAESPSASIYGTQFKLHGFSSDNKVAFMYVTGPSALTSDERALVAVELTSGKVTQKLAGNPDYTDCSLSPDTKFWLCVDQSMSAKSTFIVTEVNSTKSVKRVDWTDGQLSSGIADRWAWSADSSKMAFYGSVRNEQNNGPLTLSYLDVSTMKITNLKTLSDSSAETISNLTWLDDGTIIHDHNATTNPNNFIGAKVKIESIRITDKKVTQLMAPEGYVLNFVKVDQ